ncbi:MAG: ATP-binding cassette domain-containing protein [Hyphomonadaceae bacterium JAD_PAG50586_4]|nr:MAG: ATP-binding cassette domain-containing protein [Hyphomonadaceae bacterium JAD_PAG50586_4]
MIVALEGVSYSFGARPILNGFDFNLEAGEQKLLLGPSGSGKTTLIYLICGLISAQAGQIEVAGENLSTLSQARRDAVRRNHIGVVFQTLRLVSALSVRANLLLAQKLAGKPRNAAEADDLLQRLGIAHRAHAKPAALSQGEAQRAAIARAVIAKPALLIADEPTSALDDENTARVAELLKQTAATQGSALLIATHDARLRAHFPQIVELRGGA